MNGRQFTAHDAEYNFHRILGMGDFAEVGPTPFGGADQLKSLPWESITATDDMTLVMKLTEPRPVMLRKVLGVDNGVAFMMPPEVIEQHGDGKDWRNLVGTGPFMLTDLVEESSITFTKNPDYSGHDEKYPENQLPYVDELRYVIIPDEAATYAALRSRTIDWKRWDTSLDAAAKACARPTPRSRCTKSGSGRWRLLHPTTASHPSTTSTCCARCRWRWTTRPSPVRTGRASPTRHLRG